jgi:hypothetical protein
MPPTGRNQVDTERCIIRVIKLTRMRWVGHVTRRRRRGMHVGFWWESQKNRDYSEDLGVCGRIILKWILDK